MMFRKKTKINVLDQKWTRILTDFEVFEVPMVGEFLYLEYKRKYFEVMTVIHTITNKQTIFIVVSDVKENQVKL
jgi:hypothetical protein